MISVKYRDTGCLANGSSQNLSKLGFSSKGAIGIYWKPCVYKTVYLHLTLAVVTWNLLGAIIQVK